MLARPPSWIYAYCQSCPKLSVGQQAEFVQSHHESINLSKKFIGTRISRFTEQHIGASNRLKQVVVIKKHLSFSTDPFSCISTFFLLFWKSQGIVEEFQLFERVSTSLWILHYLNLQLITAKTVVFFFKISTKTAVTYLLIICFF